MTHPTTPSSNTSPRRRSLTSAQQTRETQPQHIADADITDADIERALGTVARVIELYGDAYFPILNRLESELEQRRVRRLSLERHLATYWKNR